MRCLRDGERGSPMPVDLNGVEGEIAGVFNEILAATQRRAEETARVRRVAGKEDALKARARQPGGVGAWADDVASLGTLIDDMVSLTELNEMLEQRVKDQTTDLERSEAALRDADRQREEFLAILAHELRNPLAPLSMGVDILSRHLAQDAAPIVATTVPRMRRQLAYMVRLRVMRETSSKSSIGSLDLKREPTDLAVLVRVAADGARPFLELGGHELAVRTDASVTAQVDAARIIQILTNLLHNAAKFTTEGGLVRVELTVEGAEAVIRVIDPGEGIAPEDIERVFGMFARIDRRGTADPRGLGLGLALARRLAEMHGGSLSASSAGRGTGTTFTIRLPVYVGEAADVSRLPEGEGAAERAADTPNKPGEGGTLNVVVIEDNPDIADTLGAWLEDLRHEVHVARSGAAGLDLVVKHRPDLVLCDLGLPEIDGLEVCRRIRTLQGSSPPRMVALTGWGREGDRRRTRDVGFDEHLVKPVSAEKLREVLQGVLNAKRATQVQPDAVGRD